MKPQQLQISFPLFPEGLFTKVKEGQKLAEEIKLQQELQHYKNRVRAYKGHTTKRKNSNE